MSLADACFNVLPSFILLKNSCVLSTIPSF
jgi:hypothetical protein